MLGVGQVTGLLVFYFTNWRHYREARLEGVHMRYEATAFKHVI
jgi:hypothetical protein